MITLKIEGTIAPLQPLVGSGLTGCSGSLFWSSIAAFLVAISDLAAANADWTSSIEVAALMLASYVALSIA